MAYKKFAKLSSRNRSALVTQLHKLISYYGAVFSPRERVYINKLTSHNDCIYWLEDHDKKLSAAAIVDPHYVLDADIHVHTIGHLVSKRPGQMDRILNHIFSDFEDKTVGILCREAVARGISIEDFGLVELKPDVIEKHWHELGEIITNYFNIKSEKMIDGMKRKEHNFYVKFSAEDLAVMKLRHASLFDVVHLLQHA